MAYFHPLISGRNKTPDGSAFYQMVLARLLGPTSRRDSLRVLTELGMQPVHRNTFSTHKSLPRTGLPGWHSPGLFQRHQVADAGMLSDTDLAAIDAAGLRFIVGSQQTTDPRDLATHLHHHADTTPVDTVTTRGRYQAVPDRINDPEEPVWEAVLDPRHWKAVWQYRAKRASRDVTTLAAQRERTMKVVEGHRPVKSARFVRTQGATRVFDQTTFDRATRFDG